MGTTVRFAGHGIKAPGMPRVTLAEAPKAQIQAANRSVGLDCLDGVVGATRIKATMITEEGADEELVAPDQDDQDLAHSFANTWFQ